MVTRKGLHSLTPLRHRGVDVFPLTALAIGAVSFFTPFVALKENRVVDGLAISGVALANPYIIALAVIATVSVAITAIYRRRQAVYIFSGLIFFWLSIALLVRANVFLGEGASPRVSPLLGFWGLPVAAYMLISHARLKRRRGRHVILILALFLPVVIILADGRGASISVVREFASRRERFIEEFFVHLKLFSVAVTIAGVIGIPMGILVSNSKRLAGLLAAFIDGAQTIPSMALFGLLMAPLALLSRTFPFLRSMGISGVGVAPALIALSLYALLPVVRNLITGLDGVSEAVLDIGRGMGMSPKQLFLRVRWPLALPYVLTGLRTASIQAVGNTAVAALIGAGGLGIMIFQGLGQAAPDLILLGVIPLILLAVTVDRMWGWLINRFVSAGLK